MADICAACKLEFETEETYLEHVCESTGFSPTQVEHQDALTGGNFSKVAEAALERGEERLKEEEVKQENEKLPLLKVSGRIITKNEREEIDSFITTTIRAETGDEAREIFIKRYVTENSRLIDSEIEK